MNEIKLLLQLNHQNVLRCEGNPNPNPSSSLPLLTVRSISPYKWMDGWINGWMDEWMDG